MNPAAPSIAVAHIEHQIPHPLVALSAETAEKATLLVASAAALAVSDSDTFIAAEGLARELHAFGRELERQRTELKAPVLELGRQIDAACKAPALAIDNAKKGVARRILDWQQKEAKRIEKERVEREEAERKERERLEAEERAAEAKRQEEQDARDLELELASLAGVDAEPAPLPAIIPSAPRPVARPIAPLEPAPVSSAVGGRKVARLVIEDVSKIPAEMGGRRLLVPDERAILDILKAQLEVPGCRIEWDTVAVMRGRS